MDSESPKSSNSAGWAAVLLALPLLYVLSIGPVGCLLDELAWCRRRPRLKNAVYAVYSPLRPLFEHESLGPHFMQYLDWWSKLAEKQNMAPDPFVPAAQDTADPFGQLPSTPTDQDPK